MSEPQATPPAKSAVDTVLSSSTLLTGLTGSGKTALLTTFILWVWQTYQKVTLVYVTDGGGIPPLLQVFVNRGIARVWKMRTRSAKGLAFETCQRAAMGWWPRKIDPRTGETEPNVALIPSIQVRHTILCPQGHPVRMVATVAAFTGQQPCPTCQTLVSPQTMKIQHETIRTPGFEQVGAVAFDGLSSMCSWMMDDLSERAGRNELGGEKGALGTIVSGDIAIGGTNRAMYGTVQQRAEAMVLASNGIPSLVVPPVWTALTLETSDEGGLPIRGPLLVGQAKTAVAPQWFGDMLEAVVTEREGKRYRRLMLQQYIDEKGIKHLCGVRSFPALLPPFLEEEEATDPSQAFQTFNLGYFYTLRERAKQATEKLFTEALADAPGLPEGLMEYGDPVAPPQAGVAGVPAPGMIGAGANGPMAAPGLSPAEMARQRARAAQTQAPPAEPAPNTTAVAPTTVPAPVVPDVSSPAPVQPASEALAAAGEGAFVAPAPPPVGPKAGLSPAQAARARQQKAAAPAAPPPPPQPAPVATPVATAAPSPMATGPQPDAPPPPAAPARGPVAPPPGRRPS